MMENNQLKFSKGRFFILLLLIIIGIALCAELSVIFYKTNFLETYKASFCTVSELIDCDGVAKTHYAVLFGVPNALWGMFLYVVMLLLLFVDRIQIKLKDTIFDVFKNPRSYIATLGLLSFAISMILAFISIFKINKICALCFCTYFIDFAIALIAKGKGFFAKEIKDTVVDFIDGAKKYFILFLIVLFSFIGGITYLEKSYLLSPKLKEYHKMKVFIDAKKNEYAVRGNRLGHKNAKVKINVYSDFYCPYCRVVNMMVHKLAKEEKIIVNEFNFPLDTSCNFRIPKTLKGHELSCTCAKYAIAAKQQGKFWGVANVIFDKQPVSEEHLIQELKKAHLGLNIKQLQKDVATTDTLKALFDDINITYLRQINATPAIEINGVVYLGAMTYDNLKEKVRLAKKRAELTEKEEKTENK